VLEYITTVACELSEMSLSEKSLPPSAYQRNNASAEGGDRLRDVERPLPRPTWEATLTEGLRKLVEPREHIIYPLSRQHDS
jgi:hypothetical protein